MKKIFLIIMILIASFILNGCASRNFSFNDARTVQIGDSKDIVIQKMGSKPYFIQSEQMDGKNIVKYIYVSVNGLTGASKSLSFILKDNKVIEIPHIPDEFQD